MDTRAGRPLRRLAVHARCRAALRPTSTTSLEKSPRRGKQRTGNTRTGGYVGLSGMKSTRCIRGFDDIQAKLRWLIEKANYRACRSRMLPALVVAIAPD